MEKAIKVDDSTYYEIGKIITNLNSKGKYYDAQSIKTSFPKIIKTGNIIDYSIVINIISQLNDLIQKSEYKIANPGFFAFFSNEKKALQLYNELFSDIKLIKTLIQKELNKHFLIPNSIKLIEIDAIKQCARPDSIILYNDCVDSFIEKNIISKSNEGVVAQANKIKENKRIKDEEFIKEESKVQYFSLMNILLDALKDTCGPEYNYQDVSEFIELSNSKTSIDQIYNYFLFGKISSEPLT